MKTFEEFVQTIIPNILTRYEFYKLCQMDEGKGLIGMDVIAIRAGFGCGSTGGTIMKVQEVHYQDWGKKGLWVRLVNTLNSGKEEVYLCYLEELPHSVTPYTKSN